MLVMDRGGRAGEVVDSVDLELEVRMPKQLRDVLLGAGEHLVDAENFVAVIEQSVDQV